MRGSIRERSPGHFAIILEQRDPATGKRKRKWHSFAGTKRQAQIECARLISEMKSGAYIEPAKLTLGVFLDGWLDHQRPLLAAPHSGMRCRGRPAFAPSCGGS